MLSENPDISVIIPVRDAEKFLPVCLDSILRQTFTRWELIIADDGSKDGTGEIADTYASADGRIKVIHSDNRGVSAARNACILNSRGRYLAFVDADDILEPDYLKVLFDLAEKNEADISQCSFCFLNEDGSKTPDPKSFVSVLTERHEIIDAFFSGPVGNVRISVWAKLFRRELLTDVRFDQSLRVYEDARFVYDCCKKVKTVCSTDAQLYLYRQHENSTMHRRLTGIYLDYFKVFELQREDFLTDRATVRKIAVREAECALWLIRVMISEGKKDERWEIRKKVLDVTGKILCSSAPLLLKAKLTGLTLMPHLYFALVKRRVLSGNEKV